MNAYSMPLQIRWADIDANKHVRHSVYFDWGAACRFAFLNQQGLTQDLMNQVHAGPVLFREECVFRKEIRFGDEVMINLQLLWAKKDFSRWSILHDIYIQPDITCATITVDGAWIDTIKRKLASPGKEAIEAFTTMPRHKEFSWRD
jgi:acyl-CoA thioester hydrolase